jgi:beta-xylosidase
MKKGTVYLSAVLLAALSSEAFAQSRPDSRTGSWGDQGNGTYINPVLNADYSDPDVIRVNNDFYMVCSEFHFMGIPVLHSRDLVNWNIIARVYDEFKFDPKFDSNERYAGGSWAPALRFHDNKFWLYFCTPDEGLFMTTAEKPEGPWAPVTQVAQIYGWEDPCPFWDEDGKAYLGRSKKGAGPIIIHKLSDDGKKLLDDGVVVYTGPVAEGTKIHKLNGYYYLSIPEGGVATGWQTVLRSKNIYGPYEKRVALEKGITPVNGPHQGSWIDLANGDWWFMHFQSRENIGRVVHLQPMRWKDDWPVIGADLDMNGIGEPVYVWKKPDVGATYPISAPQTSDEFSTRQLGFQWAWNHNPVNDAWSLTTNPGFLAISALPATEFLKAKNTVTQKVMGDQGEAITCLIITEMANGQYAGLCLMGKQYNLIGILKTDGKLTVVTIINGSVSSRPVKATKVYFKVSVTVKQGANQFLFSTDNKTFQPLGEPFVANNGFWKGPKIGLFSYNLTGNGGKALFDWFHYLYDGPK